MSSMAKTAREAMKAKAKRLGSDRPVEKVDSSTFTPPELLNADVKTGLRPVSRRAFKKGGKVMGEACEARADRKPRKSGGKTEAKEYANAKVNRNVKAANEEREGKKHIGGMARGGRKKMTSGESRQFFDRMYEQGDRDRQAKSEAYLRTPEGEADRQARNAAASAAFRAKNDISSSGMKKGGRAKKQAGGGSMPLPVPRPKNLDAQIEAREMAKQAKQADVMTSPEYRRELEERQSQMAPRKSGGRTGKLSGGALTKYLQKATADAFKKGKEGFGPDKPSDKQKREYNNRLTGMKRAEKRLMVLQPDIYNADTMKKGGRTGKLSGGTLGRYAQKAANEVGWRGADYGRKAEKVDSQTGNFQDYKARNKAEAKLSKRSRGLEQAISKMSGAPYLGGGYTHSKTAKIGSTERQADIASEGMKKGGRTKKASGGQTRAAEMMKSASDTAGVPGARMDFSSASSRFGKALGMKKGGKTHDDVAADKALIKKMVKPSARTGKQEGGGTKAPVDMEYYLRAKRRDDLGDDSVSHAIAESEARKNKAFDEKYGTQELKRGGKTGRTGRKTGGGVFSGAGYPHKIPGVVPGGRTARAAGGKAKGKTNVNIVIAAGKGGQPDMPMPPGMMGKPPGGIPVPVAPPPGAGGPQGGMPMPMPMPPGGAPAGAPGAGGPPPMARKSGGRISKVASSYKDMEAGSGGGEGRLQKTDIAKKGKGAPAFKKGGKVYRSYKDMDAGAGSGLGRMEKTEIASRKH